MKHGFATVVYPFEKLESKDIIWEHAIEIDGISYPIIERPLNKVKIETIKRIIDILENKPYDDPSKCNGCYSYIIYIENKKTISIFDWSLDSEDLSPELKGILKEILSMASPIYPNYGIGVLD